MIRLRISPKDLAILYFGPDYTESDRKNLSPKLNKIKQYAQDNQRLSQLYLYREVTLD